MNVCKYSAHILIAPLLFYQKPDDFPPGGCMVRMQLFDCSFAISIKINFNVRHYYLTSINRCRYLFL
jgi:hypothetical protein